jgi:uncharacterized protein (DUF983 family)
MCPDDLAGRNIRAPILDVAHADLARERESAFTSVCPACHEGSLGMRRHAGTFRLEEWDCCALCGQRVRYTDIDDVRSRDWAKGGAG